MVESAKIEILEYENYNPNSDNFQDEYRTRIDPYTMFLHAMKSPVTKKKYSRRLEMFFDFLKVPGESLKEKCLTFVNNGKNNANWVFINIFQFVLFHKERIHKKEISGATLINYLKAIKLFCEMSDLSINWKKITRGLSKGKRYANDRIPILAEVRKIVEYPDRRIKPIVYTMCSSGIRLGAWDYLKWKHIIPILNDKSNEIIAAKIIVYADEEEEYISFISLEAYSHLKEWMNYRKEAGELVTEESWLMRNLWDVTTPTGKGLVTIPVKLKPSGIKRLMERALWAQGVRTKLVEGKKGENYTLDSIVWGNLTFNNLKHDAEKALDALIQQPEVDANRITVLGHSDGTIIAPRIAIDNPGKVKNIVLMGAVAQNMSKIAELQ